MAACSRHRRVGAARCRRRRAAATMSIAIPVVEWRALTVALLDRLAAFGTRRGSVATNDQLPLAQVLQGGTWAAGRIDRATAAAGRRAAAGRHQRWHRVLSKTTAMEGVTVVGHPLVQHKLTLLRDRRRSTKSFRELCRELGILMCYEVTRDLPLDHVDIETPMARMRAPRLAGKKLVFAPILRAGMALVEGMLELVPAARVAHIGLYRDPGTLAAVEYFFKAPADVADRLVIVIAPVIATGKHRGCGGRPAEGAWRARHPLRLSHHCAARRSNGCAASIPTCRSGRPPSMTASTRTPIFFRALATPATGPMERGEGTARMAQPGARRGQLKSPPARSPLLLPMILPKKSATFWDHVARTGRSSRGSGRRSN